MDRGNCFNYFYLQIAVIFFMTIVGIAHWLS
jgi:hypothetical protein